jgi:UDP-2,3-diacylglucosamine pyrophosphatase LpxH
MKSGNKKYYIVHGDAFDNITRWVVWVSKFGASSYDILLTINRLYNNYRRRRGLGYKSISKGLKSNVKIVTSLISNFEGKAVLLAKNMGYDGIICGHIHTTADKMIDGIHYLNSGDWVETMSALVEDFEGKWHVRHFQDLGAAEDSGEIPVAAALEAPTEEHPGILSGKPEIGKIITTQVNRRKLLRARDDQRELIKG